MFSLLTLLLFASADDVSASCPPHRSLLQKTSRDFNFSLECRLFDPNGASLDNFGRSVFLNDNLLVVGSPEKNDNYVVADTGRVFIFLRDKHDIRQWNEIREISDGEAGEYFGWAVSIADDKTLLVGAPRSNTYGGFSGTAFYAKIEDNPYREQPALTRIIQSERHAGAFFGYSIATQTNSDGMIRVAIGAYGHKGTGAVFLYTKKSDGSFGNEVIIYASDRTSGFRFGWSVSMRLDQLVVGSPMADGYGAAYVYVRSGYQWNVNAKLQQYWEGVDDDQNPFSGDFFGLSVAAGDGVIFVGSPHNDVKKEDAGAVLVYADKVYVPDRRRLQGSANNATRRLALPEYEFSQTLFAPSTTAYQRFGWSISYDPKYGRVAVGSDYSKVSSYPGAVYIYQLSNDGFYSLEYMEVADTDEETDANFGESVSIQGDVIAIGASRGHGATYKSGDVYVFTAQTKSEYNSYMSTNNPSSSKSAGISGFTVSVIIALLAFLLIVAILWCKYKSSGEKFGFCTYIADQITDVSDYFSNSRAERGIPVPIQDESLHSSSHSMITNSKTSSNTPSSVELARPSERIRSDKKPLRTAGGARTAQLKSGLGAGRAGGYAGVQQSSDV